MFEILPMSLALNAPTGSNPYRARSKGGFRVTGFHPVMGSRAQALKLHNTFLKPWLFTSTEEEYQALRESAVLIDVTGEEVIEISGPDAASLVERLLPRSVCRLAPNRCAYAVMCLPFGGILEDGIIVKFSDDRWWWSGGPAPAEQWIYQNAVGMSVSVTSRLDELHVLSLQGPESRNILQKVGLGGVAELPYFGMLPDASMGGVNVVVTRTGYTGELGYDIYVQRGGAVELFSSIMAVGADAGLKLCGSSTLEVRRIEAGILNIGQDFDWHHTPLECGLAWMIDASKDFIGKDALIRQEREGIPSHLVGLRAPSQISAQGVIREDGVVVGAVTSSTYSPALGEWIAIARVSAAPQIGADLNVTAESPAAGDENEAGVASARFVEMPFVDPERVLARE